MAQTQQNFGMTSGPQNQTQQRTSAVSECLAKRTFPKLLGKIVQPMTPHMAKLFDCVGSVTCESKIHGQTT